MTQDYKDTLLRYFTGNLNLETGNNIPLFTDEQETLNSNVYENIETILASEQSAINFTSLGKIYNESYGVYLIYGYYENSSNNKYGFIYLVDDELNEIQMITEFASGTKLFPIVSLNQAEDGNIYGLSHTVGTTPGTLRVMLFNNIFSSGLLTGIYKAVLRNDYVVPYSYYPTFYRQNGIIKSPESSVYYIVTQSQDGNTHIVKFTINVGSTNEWNDYTINYTFQYRYAVKLDKSGGNEVFRFYSISYINEAYEEYELNGNTVTQVKTIPLEDSPAIMPGYSQVYEANGEIYVAVSYPSRVGKNSIYKVVGNTLQTIQDFPYYSTYLSYCSLFEINGGIFYIRNYNQNATRDIYIGYIKNDLSIAEELITTSQTASIYSSNYSYVDFYYTALYNLVNVYIPTYGQTNTTERLIFDYNSINYNGESYEYIQSLAPQKGRIFNNGKMIFARNIYNKTIYGNTTLSQIQVPNTLLNDIELETSNLVGGTNKILNISQDNVTKNIYETVYFNYYNSLMIQDRNTPEYVDNMLGANRINGSVSNIIGYENSMARKYRINYSDNTSLSNSINQVNILNNIATYNIQVSVPTTKTITNIEILSNDENTVYQTISGTSLESGKTYNIAQDCYVE